MLLIKCPWCGERAQTEFGYGGDATVVRPRDTASASDDEWHRYVYIRENRRGPHLEYWQHSHGCRRWFRVLRDTLTHEILETGEHLELPGEGR